MPIHLPSNQSVGEGELRRKRLGKEIGLEPRMERTMRQVDTWQQAQGWSLRTCRGELRDESDWYGTRREWGSLFHNWGAACRKERLVILRRDWTGGRRRVTKSDDRVERSTPIDKTNTNRSIGLGTILYVVAVVPSQAHYHRRMRTFTVCGKKKYPLKLFAIF